MFGSWKESKCPTPNTWYMVWTFRTRYLQVELHKHRVERVAPCNEYAVEVVLLDAPGGRAHESLHCEIAADDGHPKMTDSDIRRLVHNALIGASARFSQERKALRKRYFSVPMAMFDSLQRSTAHAISIDWRRGADRWRREGPWAAKSAVKVGKLYQVDVITPLWETDDEF